MVLGNLVHTSFEKFIARVTEKVTSVRDFKDSDIKEIVEEAISSHIVSLHQVNETEEHAREYLSKSVKSIIRWIGDILQPESKEYPLKLKQCIGTEQEYQSAKYGFRGKIDSIVMMHDKEKKQD